MIKYTKELNIRIKGKTSEDIKKALKIILDNLENGHISDCDYTKEYSYNYDLEEIK